VQQDIDKEGMVKRTIAGKGSENQERARSLHLAGSSKETDKERRKSIVIKMTKSVVMKSDQKHCDENNVAKRNQTT